MKNPVITLYKWSLLVGLTLFALWLVFSLRDIIILLFLVLVLSITILPLVEYLEKFNIPRIVSVLGIIVLLCAALLFLITNLAQSFANEYQSLSDSLIGNYLTLNERYGIEEFLGVDTTEELITQTQEAITRYVQSQASQLFNFGATVFGLFLTIITSLTLMFYLIYDPAKIKRFAISFLPDDRKESGWDIITKIEKKLAYWLQGQIFLMIIMGVISYVGFLLIGVEFALPLAILVGVLDIIPVIGPIVAFFPAIVVSAVESPTQALITGIFFILLQQVEGNVLVPRIMSKSVGLDPVAVILALLAGSTLGGILGAVLAVPVSVILMILYEEWQKTKLLNIIKDDENSDESKDKPAVEASPLRSRFNKKIKSV